ncbi:MFS transporter [Candidatus Mycobacterium methanotrophicum]|uniref:MHS family MFS transporter n=1 Tax=Candidatus Mycobacterium methanotrophicum TaxID=2943498 RepID=A0ABY4QFF6_9MYCO|nr:MFS transporter [Candidatus Mycobacterium methanotrophicum]UQX09725.1 MHS family MFS transporter [Candidatus Mycobacterium methanotrophicum]
MRRIAAACLVGSAIEFYDFLIYGTAAALVFPTVFFPHLSPTLATVASLGTFASAFVSRPIGAATFGYFGDRLGRKKTLIVTLLLMAVATVSVGVVPGTATIGTAAPLILIALRLLQGFAVGGEWAGSALLSAEHAPADARGRYGMFTLLGGGTAGVLSSLTFLGVNFSIGENSPAFMEWGWRIPFLISVALICIALYVRLRIDETPVFAEEKARNLVSAAPIAELLHLQRREILLAAGSVVGGFGFAYMGNTYLTVYSHSQLGYTRSFIWAVGALGGLASIVFVALSASLCDRVGRRRMMLLGWAGCVPWAAAVMPLMDTGKPALYAVAIVGMFAIAAIGSGPTGAFIPELFATRYRYSGSALAVNLAGVLGGALPPLIAGTLQATYGSWAVGPLLVVLALASLVCTYLLPETKGTALQSARGAGGAAVPVSRQLPDGGR